MGTRGAPRAGDRRGEVIVVGGGVLGSAAARALALAGARVTVLEKSVPGAEASSAAAGILGAQAEAEGPGPLSDLLQASLLLYPRFAAALRRETDIDVEYRPCGLLRVARGVAAGRALARETRWMDEAGVPREVLGARRVRALEPELRGVTSGVHFARDGRVDPRRLFRAVHVAAQRAGARFVTGATVRRVVVEGGRAAGVLLDDGTRLHAPQIVVAAGSWSAMVPGVPLPAGAVVPMRGQVVELEAPRPLLRGVVSGAGCYLVPRDDGRVLVGATQELVGFRREVTAGGVHALLAAALDLVPALAAASLRDSWSNFRPWSPDSLPLLGASAVPGVVLATGHHRSGILLAPVTAEIVKAVVLGRRPPVDLAPFDARRLDAPARAR